MRTRTPPLHSASATRDGVWYAREATNERLRLFSPWSIAGFGIVVCVALTLSYPHKFLEARLSSDEGRQASYFTAEYLRVFLEADPNAHGMRANLVRQFIQLGALADARAALLPLWSAGDGWAQEADWIELEIREQEAFAEEAGSPRRVAMTAEVSAQIRVLLKRDVHAQRVLWLAHKALAMEDSETALLVMRHLADNETTVTTEQYVQAARIALGLKDYRTSAALYFRAMAELRMLGDRRALFIEGLRTLQAGGLHNDAVTAIGQHIGPLGKDRETLLFVIRLAQSANRLDIAQHYALQLLYLSIAMQLEAAGPKRAGLSGGAAASNSSFFLPVSLHASAPSTAMPIMPFDEEVYSLSYDVFLANGNHADARLVAEWAVRQRPDSAVWRRRLAQVYEWSNAPREALPQWLAYARLTDGMEAWERVLSLAQGLHDSQAVVEALERKAELEPGNQRLFERLLTTYEYIGEPERALKALRKHIEGRAGAEQRQRNMTLFANLAERMGRDDEALHAWQQMQREFGPRGEYALHIAVLLNRRGKVQDAYAALEDTAPVVASENGEFWRAYAELARLLQEDNRAIAGYRQLLRAGNQESGDLINLIALIESDRPQVAARIARFGFSKTGDVRFVQLALNASMRAGDYEGALQFVRTPQVQETASLKRNHYFLSTRATLMQQIGELSAAERDLRAALSLRPADSAYRAGLIWLLIAQRDTIVLKRLLSQWAGDAENDRALWGAFAAAHMALNRQRDALHWFRKSGFARDDYLWLMSYAEALEANSQPDLAWRLRRHVWLELRRPELLQNASRAELKAMRERLTSLAPLFAAGDGADAIIKALLRADIATWTGASATADPSTGRELADLLEDVALPNADSQLPVGGAASPAALFASGSGRRPNDDHRLSASAREVALAYAMSREAHGLARAWLATRFARQLATPVWADLSLALAADDRQRLARLLDDMPDWLPMYDRIEAAQRTGQTGFAQTLAFDQMTQLPYDEELHARFTALAANAMPALAADSTQVRQWPLSRTESRLQFAAPLTQRLDLALAVSEARQSTNNTAELRSVPANEQTIEAGLRFAMYDGMLTAALQQRYAERQVFGLSLSYDTVPGAGMNLLTEVGIRQPANESALLRVGAVRSGITTSLTYVLGKTEYLRAGLGWQRYASQAGTDLGRGASWNLEAGTHLRVEYPNLTLRAYASGDRFASSGQTDAQMIRLLPADADTNQVLPQDSTVVGLSVGIGNVVDGRYTRAWRPFADIGISHSNESGRGLNITSGVAGSVFGSDTLQLRFTRSAGTPASPNGYREIGVNYIWLY